MLRVVPAHEAINPCRPFSLGKVSLDKQFHAMRIGGDDDDDDDELRAFFHERILFLASHKIYYVKYDTWGWRLRS